MRASEFAQMDLDHDGRLSFSEFEGHHRSLVDRAFAAFDRDADNRLSRQEFMAPKE
ncbi:EF-hand domain-containing protein [Aminobacter carboxidus]|uniref:EF-hand domain-containing protein n=1 Tax=Aminobacter carboxidus TaxID=376165 RepID=UPI0028B212ED|nr:EF-hand domain-containing protein [Aminobacter lissarensis]